MALEIAKAALYRTLSSLLFIPSLLVDDIKYPHNPNGVLQMICK